VKNSWYKGLTPKVIDVKSSIKDLALKIKEIEGVKHVLVWGSFVKNKNVPDYPLRDLDIIAVASIPSEDLIAIVDDSTLSLKVSQLEEDGFNPLAINFTKKFTEIEDFNMDHWAISKDKKLLHYGPITDNREEWKDVNKEAEKSAIKETGMTKYNLRKASAEVQQTWYTIYRKHFDNYHGKMPNGWYESEQEVKDILKETQKIW